MTSIGARATWNSYPSFRVLSPSPAHQFLVNGDKMPLHTVALGAALTPTVIHTLINHVGHNPPESKLQVQAQINGSEPLLTLDPF